MTAPVDQLRVGVNSHRIPAQAEPIRGDNAKVGPQTGQAYRSDIEGLRAVAVLLVLLWHAGVPLVSGGFIGVDVFFVISGFLITGLLVSEMTAKGRISLVKFYARRAKRLLPAVAVVLGSVLALTYLFLPEIRWKDTAGDVIASAFYVVNWQLADRSVDYLAADNAQSIVQHFWSLAVEEQFYLLWPLLIVLATGASRLWKLGSRSRRLILLVLLLCVGVPSLIWSFHLTFAEPGRAYFVTTSRLWELAIGAVLAVCAGTLAQIPRWVAVVGGWIGLALIVGSAIVLNESTPFPGYAALFPTLGAGIVVAAGVAAANHGPAILLGTSVLRAIGTLSYSLYLWHWPLLIVAEAKLGELSVATSTAFVALSFIPAYLTYRLVENPLRHSALLTRLPSLTLGVGVICTVLPVMAAAAFLLPERQPKFIPANGMGTSATGAAVLGANPDGDPKGLPVDSVDWFTPSATDARGDLPAVYDEGCHAGPTETELKFCAYGDKNSEFTAVLVGDSHAAQWVSPFQHLAATQGWRLLTYTKSSCPFIDGLVLYKEQPYQSCDEWNRALRADLLRQRPDVVITSNSIYKVVQRDGSVGPDGTFAMVSAMRLMWGDLVNAGIRVVVIRDTPRPRIDVAECVSANAGRLSRCSVDRVKALTGIGEIQKEAAKLSRAAFWDLNAAICPTPRCAAIIGNVLVYRDSNHITDTYAISLSPRIAILIDPIRQSSRGSP